MLHGIEEAVFSSKGIDNVGRKKSSKVTEAIVPDVVLMRTPKHVNTSSKRKKKMTRSHRRARRLCGLLPPSPLLRGIGSGARVHQNRPKRMFYLEEAFLNIPVGIRRWFSQSHGANLV